MGRSKLLGIAAAVSACGCAAPGSSLARLLDARGEGARIALLAGEILFLRLPGDPSGRRTWREERAPDPRVLRLRGVSVHEVRAPEGVEAPPAFEIWEFLARAPGATEILLRAAGEGGAEGGTYRLEVTVKSGS